MSLRTVTERRYQKKLGLVFQYIHTNLDRTLSIDELSSIAHISKFHFHRIFFFTTGENVLQYIKRCRLEKAAELLSESTESITAIALNIGYNSSSAFTKSFTKQFNCNPSNYRRQRRGNKPK